MRLIDCEVNKDYYVDNFALDSFMITRLNAMGIQVNSKIRVINEAPFKGAILVLLNGNRLAIRRHLASKILVESK